jgi:L-iditol 2-dehydrogenase
MRAAVLAAPRRIVVREVPAPRAPRRGEALVRVTACGICRSDLHYYLHGRIGSQVIRIWPQTLGHEPAGDVVAVGPGVRGIRPGNRVAIEPAIPCGRCRECRAGRPNICTRHRFLGLPGMPGALAESLVMPVANLVRVPRSVSAAEAAALEPLAIGLHAVRLLGRRALRAAAVVGAGPVGLCVLAALRAAGARVTICDYVPARLRVARRMGAARAVLIRPRRPMRDQAAALGDLAVVFEAGGTPEAVDLALRAVWPGGTVALIGIMDGDRTPVNLHVARRKELTILNVRRSNGELAAAARMVASGKINLRPMLTHRGGLPDAASFFALVNRRASGVVKAVIEP